jgi:hypothetical protein
MFPRPVFPGFEGQILVDQPALQGEWRRDPFGRLFVAYRPVHLLTVSHGPFVAPTVVEVG